MKNDRKPEYGISGRNPSLKITNKSLAEELLSCHANTNRYSKENNFSLVFTIYISTVQIVQSRITSQINDLRFNLREFNRQNFFLRCTLRATESIFTDNNIHAKCKKLGLFSMFYHHECNRWS